MGEMRLWLLRQTRPAGYDENVGFVVRATTERDARAFAADEAADEGTACWLDGGFSSCVPVPQSGPAEIILGSFRAG